MESAVDISICEGGERLYVHPFSVSPNRSKGANRVYYLRDSEMAPYENDFLISPEKGVAGYRNVSFLWALWYGVIYRLLVSLIRVFSLRYQHGVWISWAGEFERAAPFLAASYPNFRFGLSAQLAVLDHGRRTVTYYLNPSQSWIETRLMSQVEELQRYEQNVYWLDDWEAFLRWQAAEKAKGREVHYLVSLDT